MISTGGNLTILESVDSTNNYAMAMVRTGLAKHGDGYFANAQLQGKGQRGKVWQTEPGTNIILSLAMRPLNLTLSRQFHFSAAIALAVRDFFDAYSGGDTTIKWPNDIYWRDRKAGGILIENIIVGREATDVRREASDVRREAPVPPKPDPPPGMDAPVPGTKHTAHSTQHPTQNNQEPAPNTQHPAPNTSPWQWAIVGMGININQTSFPENLRNAVSLKQITGKTQDVIELAKELCQHVEKRYRQLLAGNDLVAEYNQHLFMRDQIVTLKKDNRVFSATIKDVTPTGELVVMTAMEEHFGFGEIEWIL